MVDLALKQRQRADGDKRAYLINALYKLGVWSYNEKTLNSISLTELEQIYINEKCRLANALGDAK